jgi:chorismate mutase/prephenate dehydratase
MSEPQDGAAATRARLARIRAAIDGIDAEILERLNRRAELALEVGRVKERQGAAFYVPGREEDLVRRLQDANPGPFPDQAIRPVWKEIISASLSLEKSLTVAYFGPQGTFTHQACLKQFGLSAQFLPVRTISDVFDAVEKGKTPYGVIPIENTTEGVVNHTLDMFLRSELKIVAEVLLRVSHNLLNLSGRAEDVCHIYSHPQPLGQCRSWLQQHFPEIPVLDATSTAQAAKLAAEDPDAAAVASALAADLYGLRTVEARIEDNADNFTRFLVIGREIPERGASSKTSILFAVRDAVGALYRMLQPFYECEVNLTKIESRPSKERAWQYVFFVDMEGHVDDAPLQRALSRLEPQCHFVKVLGSYPEAKLPE